MLPQPQRSYKTRGGIVGRCHSTVREKMIVAILDVEKFDVIVEGHFAIVSFLMSFLGGFFKVRKTIKAKIITD